MARTFDSDRLDKKKDDLQQGLDDLEIKPTVKDQIFVLREQMKQELSQPDGVYIPTVSILRGTDVLAHVRLRSPQDDDPVVPLVEALALTRFCDATEIIYVYDSTMVMTDGEKRDAFVVVFTAEAGIGSAYCLYSRDFDRDPVIKWETDEVTMDEQYSHVDLEQALTVYAMVREEGHLHDKKGLEYYSEILTEEGHKVELFDPIYTGDSHA